MRLLNDVTRCDGKAEDSIIGYAEECHKCLRRTSPRQEYVWMGSPPEFIEGVCPERIAE